MPRQRAHIFGCKTFLLQEDPLENARIRSFTSSAGKPFLVCFLCLVSLKSCRWAAKVFLFEFVIVFPDSNPHFNDASVELLYKRRFVFAS